MDSIIKSYNRVIERVDDKFNRYMYSKIAWNDRMIGIKGPRGVGKTTLLLQHIKAAFPDRSKALYATLDNIWFSKHTLTELVEYHYTHGGTHIFLDEVHRYRLFPWAQELKNVYDSYPDMHIVFTGSSLLELDNSVADLSRRCRMYEMYGLSFREYIKMVEGLDLDVLCLDDVLSKHTQIAAAISKKIKVLPLFEKYLRCGFFPFFGDMDEEGYYARISQIITTIIENDIPAVDDVEYSTLLKTKQILIILAENVPFTLNVSKLCGTLGITRNQLLRLFNLLQRGGIIRQLFTSERVNMKALVKPEKILFDNTNIMYALGNRAESGTVRESFVANQLSLNHRIMQPSSGDLLIDDRYTLEIGGVGKGFAQIGTVPDSYVVADGIEIGVGNKIPMWLFGMLY